MSQSKKKIAYMVATFPALTETFILREYDELSKNKNLELYTIALCRPLVKNVEFKNLSQSTFYLHEFNIVKFIFITAFIFLTTPSKGWKGLRLLLKICSISPISSCPRICYHFLCSLFLCHHFKREGINAIHSHFWSATNIALFTSIISGIPFSFTIHANSDLFKESSYWLNTKVKHATHVITDSTYNRSFINLLTHYQHEEKIHVIYNSLNIKEFSNRDIKSQREGKLKVLSVASITPFKGYHTVLKALATLKESRPNFEYHIVGKDYGNEQNILERLIEKYNLTDHIKFLGPKSFESVKREFQWCDLFIIASEIAEQGIRDGCPTVIAEAMLSQRCVISTYVSDIPNLITHKKSGFLFHEKDHASLAMILSDLYDDFSQTIPLINTASAFAKKRFSPEKNIGKLAYLLLNE